MEAFAGESQANRKYIAFAAQADKEGFAQAARLFRAAAEAEAVEQGDHVGGGQQDGGHVSSLGFMEQYCNISKARLYEV